MMKSIKQLLIVFLVIAAMLAGSVSALALPDRTLQQKADVLNAIKIITGTNGQYNLDSQLKRCEAVTYLIRLIGKAEYVIQNQNFYKITPYTDVDSTAWYAPYVGYASEYGYISKGSTLFKPNDLITDQEFIQLVLGALDYKEGIDYTADKVLDKAWEIGLINTNFYVARYSKSYITTRATVVELLYTALSLKTRTGDKVLCQKLVEEGAATRKQLTTLGFLEDKTVTEITQVNTLDLNKVEVKFNENVTFVSAVKVYEKNNPNIVISCSIQSLNGNTLILQTAISDASKEYVIELTGVEDEEENTVSQVQKSFKGFESKPVTSDFFRISKIEADNNRSVKVYFTHPVSLNSEIGLYYSIIRDNIVVADGRQGAIKAGVMNSEKNVVVLSLNPGVLDVGGLYTLQIDGNLMSAYGVKMNNGLGDSMKFVVGSGNATTFALKQITATDKKTLLLSFTKEVNAFLAEQIFNFYLTDENNSPIKINTTGVSTNGDGVYLNLGQDLSMGKKYWLTINNLNDVSRQEYITEKKFDFIADLRTIEEFIINGIHVPDNRTIELSFNRPLDKNTALNTAYYTISGGYFSGIHPESVIYNPINPNKVKLIMSKYNQLSEQSLYSIRVEYGMKDHLGNLVTVSGVNFTGSSAQRAGTTLESVIPVSTDGVKVTFTEDIAFNQENLSPSNFTLEYIYNNLSVKKIPIGIIFVDGRTLVLKFDAIEYNTAYRLNIGSITDITDINVKGLEKTFELKVQ